MAEQALNLPQIIAVLLVGFLVIRWFLSSSSPRQGASGRPRPQINPAHVEQIYQMFPQLDRRTIIWDLTQNGGSGQATTERVLSGRALAQVHPVFTSCHVEMLTHLATAVLSAAIACIPSTNSSTSITIKSSSARSYYEIWPGLEAWGRSASGSHRAYGSSHEADWLVTE